MTSVEYPVQMPGKPWDEMTKEERRASYDVMEQMFKGLATELEKDFDTLLIEAKAPLRVKVEIHLTITDNNEDPRLP
jgi:hypothetical protein